MKSKKKYSILLFLTISLGTFCYAIDTPQEVVTGFSQGKAEMISKYFKSTVELAIDNNENIYSSTQAEIILKDFFKKNPPLSFSMLHEGGKGESKYAIGSLKTSNGIYRVTILLKQENNQTFIHQLRIEKDEV